MTKVKLKSVILVTVAGDLDLADIAKLSLNLEMYLNRLPSVQVPDMLDNTTKRTVALRFHIDADQEGGDKG